ncbi:6-hydroxymethylpterin diphosphokinase MptE-like protein [Eubacterium callanderi]|uniref:6-hydroxymethylpterin diphosphokinase MptE-like protein n=1 Tax=Eubacterium callanderi TaxID=53442 RepID=UPI001C129343|nr:6-hydroxymethylpterin diphosphokinase MptE-like protein [Eubacterium callanderi]MBU5305038.1 DUF115 domain-containing protein [Eubacterium callanderi]
MFYQLKKLIKSNDRLADFCRYFYIPFVALNKLSFNIGAYLRKKNYCLDKNYKSLREYKNIHEGKRCFIVATGPSLTTNDLDKLTNEITFSMNSIYVSFGDTKWRPTYYGIQDRFVYEKIHKFIHENDYESIFIGSTISKHFKIKKSSKINYFPLDLLWQQIPRKDYHTKFSDNIYERVYSGYNIAFSMLQIAVYMGFKEIYLLGQDCNYQQEKKYFIEDNNRKEEKYFTKRHFKENTNKFIFSFQVAYEYALKHNIKIYNATRGGMLEVFPRVVLDDVLKNI